MLFVNISVGDIRVPSSLLKDLPKNSEASEDDVVDADTDSAPSSSSSVDSSLLDAGSTHLSRSDPQADGQAIFRLLEEGETVGFRNLHFCTNAINNKTKARDLFFVFHLQITHMFRCARIQGLDTVEGLLLFVREHFYIVDGFTLFTSKDVTDIVDIDSLPPEYATFSFL